MRHRVVRDSADWSGPRPNGSRDARPVRADPSPARKRRAPAEPRQGTLHLQGADRHRCTAHVGEVVLVAGCADRRQRPAPAAARRGEAFLDDAHDRQTVAAPRPCDTQTRNALRPAHGNPSVADQQRVPAMRLEVALPQPRRDLRRLRSGTEEETEATESRPAVARDDLVDHRASGEATVAQPDHAIHAQRIALRQQREESVAHALHDRPQPGRELGRDQLPVALRAAHRHGLDAADHRGRHGVRAPHGSGRHRSQRSLKSAGQSTIIWSDALSLVLCCSSTRKRERSEVAAIP